MRLPDLQAVREAAARIAGHVHRTPVQTSRTFDAELGVEAFFKCENLQKVGAFKARGAVNAVLSLSEAEAGRGVITHSSGNHGAALAYAAGVRGVSCTVVMAEGVSRVKVSALEGYGARIVFCRPGERETTCSRLAEETGATFVHPYDDARIIAGQGTAALELMEQVPGLDAVIAPVGGGGLLSGTALAVRGLDPRASVLGAEPEAVDDAFRSLRDGVRHPAVPEPNTLADGLLTGLGEHNFRILSDFGVQVITVSEAEIVRAARDFLQRMKLVVEPSGATVLAALRARPEAFRGKRVGAILSGGNTDFAWLT